MQGNELKTLLSSNIRRMRKKRGLTQFALGEKANLSEDTIRSIELTRNWPSEKTLTQIAEALEIEVFTLFIPNAESVCIDTKKSKEIKELIAENLKNYIDEVLQNL